MRSTDAAQVRLTGENSFIRLAGGPDAPVTTRASHWRILYSPAGAGHVLFLESDVTDGAFRIYADNEPLARWLQGEIEITIHAPFADTSAAVTPARFWREGDLTTGWTEVVEAAGQRITLSWADLLPAFVLTVAAGSAPNRPHGVYSCFFSARRATVQLGERVAAGAPQRQMRDEWESTTACLALSETWVRP